MVQEIDRPRMTHQSCTPASDRPTDCVGCPVDSILAEERGFFEGSSVFRGTLWSRHEGEANKGIAGCSLKGLKASWRHLRSDGLYGPVKGVRRYSAFDDCAQGVLSVYVGSERRLQRLTNGKHVRFCECPRLFLAYSSLLGVPSAWRVYPADGLIQRGGVPRPPSHDSSFFPRAPSQPTVLHAPLLPSRGSAHFFLHLLSPYP
jgi:hypothetical protein